MKNNINKNIDANKKVEKLVSVLMLIVAAVIIVFRITADPFKCKVSGSSMYPTYKDGDVIYANRIKDIKLERFDVVIVNTLTLKHRIIIKRIVGLPGDSVKVDELGKVYVNGEELTDYYPYPAESINEAFEEIVLGEDEYFVMGDNVNNSLDSRFSEIGIISKDKIIGVVKN